MTELEALESELKETRGGVAVKHNVVLSDFIHHKKTLMADADRLERIVRFCLASPVLSEAVHSRLCALPELSGEKDASKKVDRLISLYQSELSVQRNAARELEFQKSELEKKVAEKAEKIARLQKLASHFKEKAASFERVAQQAIKETEMWKARAMEAEGRNRREKKDDEELRRMMDDAMNVVDSIIDKSGRLAAVESSYFSDYHSDSSFANE